jgi:predicted transcriptional regulator
MMRKRTTPRPTDAELAILRVLWRQGPSTVRQVFDVLSRQRAVGYTTVLKLLQIMTQKGLVARDETRQVHVCRARISQDKTQRQLLRHLLERAFDGSAQKLVMQALKAKKTSPAELAEIRQLLDQLESRRHGE